MVIRMTVLTLTKPPCLQSHKRHGLRRSKNQWKKASWPLLLHMRAKQQLLLLYMCGFSQGYLCRFQSLQVPISVLT